MSKLPIFEHFLSVGNLKPKLEWFFKSKLKPQFVLLNLAPEREQFYLHQFTPGQPDLNYRNPDVYQEMLDVLTFWMDRGCDGYRMDAVM